MELFPQDITVTVYEAIDPEYSWCSYRFLCPNCEEMVDGTASGHAAKWLLRAGAPHYIEHVPDEAREPHRGGLFTEEDVQELLIELDEFRISNDLGD